MPITYLDEVQAAAGEVLVAVPADALGNPTPCEEWDLAALIDHLVDAQWMFVGFATGESPRERDARPSSGDFVAAYDAGAAAIRDLVGVEGFEQQTLQLPFGPFTGAQLIDFVCLETLTHAWDVAMATSQSTDLAPEPARHVLAVATQMMGGSSREGNENFGASRPPAEDAAHADRLAAYLGRSVP